MGFAPPEKVLKAAARAVAVHPFARSGAIADTPRTHISARALWVDLLESSPTDRPAKTLGLTKLQRRLLVFSARLHLENIEAIKILSWIYGSDDRIELAGDVAWLAYALGDGEKSFVPHSQAAFEREHAGSLWREIVSSSLPINALLQHYRGSRKDFVQWLLDQPDLVRDGVLVARMQRVLIQPDELVHTVTQETSYTILEWATTRLPDSRRVGWFNEYMEVTHRRHWEVDDAILHEILSRFESPERDRPFWNGVRQPLHEKFVLWLREVELTKLLGKSERLTFWLQFLPYLKKSTGSPSQDAVFLNFGKWFAVQFIEMGRATYLFPISEFRSLTKLRDPRLYSAVLDRKDVSLGVYAHRGIYWQYRAADVVRHVLRSVE